jgi:integrase
MHSSCMLRDGARPGVVRDILGHASIDVTQNAYDKELVGRTSRRGQTRCFEDVTNASQSAKKKDEKKNQPESGSFNESGRF